MDAKMRVVENLFICASGTLLPRWQEAFDGAVATSTFEDHWPYIPEYVWLRLQHDLPVAKQIEQVRKSLGDATIIALSDTPNDEEGMAVLSASARGYVNSHAAPEVLRQVAAVVSQGGMWIGESLMSRLLTGMNRLASSAVESTPAMQGKLTEREWQVAQAISDGASNKEVARLLDITERTVKAHVGVIFAKLEVRDRLQLALKIRARRSI
jgi:DNA-binding NarL/FixJ family response regulator